MRILSDFEEEGINVEIMPNALPTDEGLESIKIRLGNTEVDLTIEEADRLTAQLASALQDLTIRTNVLERRN